jgi:hypothetical protein
MIVGPERCKGAWIEGESFLGAPQFEVAEESQPRELARRLAVRGELLEETDDTIVLCAPERRLGFTLDSLWTFIHRRDDRNALCVRLIEERGEKEARGEDESTRSMNGDTARESTPRHHERRIGDAAGP